MDPCHSRRSQDHEPVIPHSGQRNRAQHRLYPQPKRARAFAVLQVASAANLAAFYVRRGNLAAAKRKAVVLLKSLQALEVQP